MSKKHYEVNNANKQIRACIELLTDAELKIVKNYISLGYELVGTEKPKKEKATPEEQKNNPLSAVNVQKYLKANATAEQQEQYWKLYNKQAKDKKTKELVFYKNDDTKNKKYKAGDPKPVGHIGTIRWFKETFPEYCNK